MQKSNAFYLKVLSLSIGLIAFVTLGCKPEQKENTTSKQMQRVMAIHDSVMPKMKTIGKLVGQLKPLADSSQQGIAYQLAMKDLQEANTAMMDWMKGFGDRFKFEEIHKGKELTAEKEAWLEEEEVKVKVMRDKVNSSIERAETLLKILDTTQTDQ
ncbi:hypothetical protein [Robiginitalea sp. IMCC43444]|uniref:hypothetical protein n=1 Tax=Robiginitalea sp. IMCC43444 TaxID=3459121 RepID=UPI00404143A6